MQVEFTNQFQRDFAKRIAGTALDAEFEVLLDFLSTGEALPTKHRDQPLICLAIGEPTEVRAVRR